jgi:hypothetical protein
VLSRFPIVAHTNQDISAHAFESRGLLHCVMQLKRGYRSSTASMSISACSSAADAGRSTP